MPSHTSTQFAWLLLLPPLRLLTWAPAKRLSSARSEETAAAASVNVVPEAHVGGKGGSEHRVRGAQVPGVLAVAAVAAAAAAAAAAAENRPKDWRKNTSGKRKRERGSFFSFLCLLFLALQVLLLLLLRLRLLAAGQRRPCGAFLTP